MSLKLSSAEFFGDPKYLANKHGYSRTTSKWWHVWITVRFNKRKDSVTTLFKVNPPITTPRKLWKELSFRTASYKELCKWLNKNKDKIGTIK